MIKYQVVKSELKRNNKSLRDLLDVAKAKETHFPDGFLDALAVNLAGYSSTTALLGNAINLDKNEMMDFVLR